MNALDKFKRLKIVVGIPSVMDLWHEKFAMSLIQMVSYFQQHGVGKFRSEEVLTASLRSSILPNARLDLVKYAQSVKASHLLFIDTDQTFPKDLIHRLLAHRKLVVACNIAAKTIPSQPTARSFNPEKPWAGDRVYNQPGKGLEKVWRVGTGVMLVDMKVFDTVGLDVWGMPWKPDMQKYQGEDWTFVEACEKAGIDVFIDHDASELVKHWGLYGYDHNVVGDTVRGTTVAQRGEDVAAA